VTASSVLRQSAVPAGTAPRFPAGIRLTWLHLRSRRAPAAILALAACGTLLRATLSWHLTFNSGQYAQQAPMVIEAGAAAVIAVATHGPFGEVERATGRWLPHLRLFAALALTGAAILALQSGAVGEGLNEGILMLARNVIGFTGLGLLCALVTGGLLAWILPMGYMVFCQYALLAAWRAPWTWPVRPPADPGAWICASVIFAVALLLLTILGPRGQLSDDS
jgi:hypothetical protein